MKNLIYISLILFSFSLYASKECKIITGDKILLVENINIPNYYFKSSTCTYQTNKKWFQILTQGLGKISIKTINRRLSHVKIKMTPNVVRIFKLKNIIHKNIQNESIILKNLKFTIPLRKLYFKNEVFISSTCNYCNTAGAKNFSLKISNPLKSTEKTFWGNLQNYIQRSAYIAKKDIFINETKLSKKYFTKKIILTQSPKTLFTNIDYIKFLKNNKSIMTGDIILKKNFYSQNIIKAYSPIQLIIRSGSITLRTMAKALESGNIGQYIRVENRKTKKKLLGKITDFNQVEVTL